MSDSGDSDDTEILLLIPPNYFITNAEAKLQLQQKIHHLQQQYPDLHLHQHQEKVNVREINMETIDASAAYQFLPPNKKTELNNINAQLQCIQHDDHLSAPSDISTISNNTVRTQFKNPRQTRQVVHSTPKCGSPPHTVLQDDGVLHEIENYFDGRRWRNRSNDDVVSTHITGRALEPQEACNSLPNGLHRLTLEEPVTTAPAHNVHNDSNLISLCELWGKSGHLGNTAIGPLPTTTTSTVTPQTTLKEEQLRRQHLEKTVHSLQSRMLEYQQRLSVAIEVDRSKDAALAAAHTDISKWQTEVHALQEQLQRANAAQVENADRLELVQRELAQAMSMASKFQEKNENLEAQLAAYNKRNSESSYQYKQQVEELELKLHTSRRSEDYANGELHKLKDKIAKIDYQNEKLRVRCDELEQERVTLRQQKDSLHDMQQKAKQRADALEIQRKLLQETVKRGEETETALKRKIELQQKSLKAHYQQQLEHVVAQKLREFQEQLDRTEESLRTEARERERLLAERAVKQLELINEKSELELNLLQEKHNEEVELYRIQLANASKKIDALEGKLNSYKTKRANIAERLHDVMETQWQKALEILTSPTNQPGQPKTIHTDANESPDNNETNDDHNNLNTKDDEQRYETPKTSKQRKTHTKENNLNTQKTAGTATTATDDGKEHINPQPIDRLQAYIELLLSKSPSDFDKLDEILALSKRSKDSASKWDKSFKRNHNNNSNKPPWKA